MIRNRNTLPLMRVLTTVWGLVALVACSNNYQAPVTEAGQRQVITPPLIVENSDDDSARRLPVSQRAQASSARPVTSSTSVSGSAQRPGTHRVQSGETLFSIAFQYDLDFRSLAIANDLDPPYTIFVDQVLSLNVDQPRTGTSTRNSSIGTPVSDNAVAQTRAGNTGGGVIRQRIGSQQAPDWQWPHRGSVVRDFSVSGNEGLDIAGALGDPVYAAGNGDVVYTGRGIQGVGNLIIIRHNDRYLSAYGHNSVMLVAEGAHVQAGQKIAEVGENGAGIPMLHFEIREEGKSIDPKRLLPR